MKPNESVRSHSRTAEMTVERMDAVKPPSRRAGLVRKAGRLRVGDLMTPEPAALRPEDDLSTLYDLLDTRHVRHVPVVDDDGDLVGLVTHRDLLRCALAEESELPLSLQRDMLTRKSVGEIMTAEPETAETETDIRIAALTMLDNKYGCLPVVEGARLVGILTEADFVRYLAERETPEKE